jgi:MFS family permease
VTSLTSRRTHATPEFESSGFVAFDWRVRKPQTPVIGAAAVSFLGDGLLLTALPLLARTLTSDARLITGVVVAEMISAPLSPVIAAAVDRYGRPRRVMIAMDLARAFVLAALVGAVAWGGGLYVLYPAALLLGAGTYAFNAASFSLVRQIVSDDELDQANGQLHVAESAAQHLAGPVVGGLAFAVTRTLPFVGDAISFLASSLVLTTAPDVRTETTARPLRNVVAEGIAAVRSIPAIWVSTFWIAAIALAHGLQFSGLVLISDRLGLSNAGFGLLLVVIAVGNLVGGLLTPRMAKRFRPFVLLAGATLVGAIANIGAAVADRSVPLVAFWLAVDGISVVVGVLTSVGVRQRLAPAHLVGSVMTTTRMVSYGAMLPSGLLAGVLAKAYGMRAVLFIVGIGIGLVFVIGFRPLRRAMDSADLRAESTQLLEEGWVVTVAAAEAVEPTGH